MFLLLFFVVKMIVKFIRKGFYCNRLRVGRVGEKKGETFPAPCARNWSKDSEWWSSSLVLYFLAARPLGWVERQKE
jgi:hypothetical protein